MANEQELRIVALAEGIGADIKTGVDERGDLTSLTTTEKSSLVGAINEVDAATAGGGSDLAIAARDTNTLDITSSTGNDATIPAVTTTLSGLSTGADKTKLDGIAAGATANSADATLLARANHTGTQLAATISDFTTQVQAVVVDGAPGALDTLNELAAALGDDANYATTTSTAIGNRVRYDAAQTLTVPQRDQACANIGVGDPDRDFLAAYVAIRDA